MFKCHFYKEPFFSFLYYFGCAGPSLLHVGFPLQWLLWLQGTSSGAQAQWLWPMNSAAPGHAGSSQLSD